ncbi:hypothetical protein DH2020_026978 [Rehmannia glutinosa]|uniref:RCC1-like domain-containing protein n=1 Tax=Rehmannia glutinosa TaxID=99300 RepID=A0ABR0VX77_REHGL
MEQVRQMVQEDDDEEQQKIWSWGAGTDGQLATGRLQDEHSPQLLRSLSAFGHIISLSCGGAHVIAISTGGRVLTWGGEVLVSWAMAKWLTVYNRRLLRLWKALLLLMFLLAGITLALFQCSDSGAIFTCGDGSFGQLGHGDFKSQCSPLEVSYFGSKHIDQVACGMRHSLVLLRDNEENQVYGFGSGKRGQLGISTDKVKSTSLPQITMGLTNLKIINISANGDHSAALSADGNLYTWGRGFGRASDACVPRRFEAAFSLNEVALGWNHALLLTREGELFMLGGDRHGVLGDSQKTSLTSDVSGKSKEGVMQIIPDLMGSKVVQIAAGAEHSALVTGKKSYNGSIMTWGWGEHGQLGLGDTNDQTAPRVVSLGDKFDEKNATSRVYCGSGFSFVLRTYDVGSEKR